MSMTNQTIEQHSHDNVITAFFDTRVAAEKAKADILAAGVSHDTVTITEGRDTSTTTSTSAGEGEGFWNSLKNMFAPEEDKHAYAEGLHRGGFLLTAHTSETDYDRVMDILDAEGAVDMNQREAQWRSEGWTGHNEGYATATASTAAAGSVAALGTSTAAAGGTGMVANRTAVAADHDTSRVAGTGAVGALGTLGEETIQLAEERLRVGKRDVNHGRVRLRSYVVEKPVNESVNLHSERVDVSRRPVDRALGAGENLFQERTLSAEEHDEEAVVSKEARVVEEVSLGKVVQDRTQEIHDTVRKTEVEIDDGRTGHVGGRAAVDGERVEDVADRKNRPL